jgi:DHA1 family bicyclomycin/chloramphenicol resistance-like MFS transporter
LPKSQAGLIALLGSMTALGAVAGDIYLPSLPELVQDLDSSRFWVQSTVTATIGGGAIGQLLVGPISDRHGRRRPALIGIALHVVASVGIVFTPNVGVLLALRVLQGVGAASSAVTAMAMVRDMREGHRAAKLLSQLVLVIGVAPLLAPTAGTLIAGLGTWRYTFVFLALVGVGLGAAVAFKAPDTRSAEAKAAAGGLGAAFRAYGTLARDGQFMGLAVIPALAQSVVMAWIVSSPFLLQTHYGLSQFAFAAVFAATGAGLVVGAQANAAVVHRFEPKRLLRVMLPLELGCVLGGLGAALIPWGGLAALVAFVVATLVVSGFVPSNATALALSRHGARAGAASALIGFMQSAFTVLVVGVLSAWGDTQAQMAAVQTAGLVLALAALAAGGAYRRRPPK